MHYTSCTVCTLPFSDTHTHTQRKTPFKKLWHTSEPSTHPHSLFLIQDPHPPLPLFILLLSFNPTVPPPTEPPPPCVNLPKPLKWANQSSMSSQIVFSMTKENLCDHLCQCVCVYPCLYMRMCVCVCSPNMAKMSRL